MIDLLIVLKVICMLFSLFVMKTPIRDCLSSYSEKEDGSDIKNQSAQSCSKYFAAQSDMHLITYIFLICYLIQSYTHKDCPKLTTEITSFYPSFLKIFDNLTHHNFNSRKDLQNSVHSHFPCEICDKYNLLL